MAALAAAAVCLAAVAGCSDGPAAPEVSSRTVEAPPPQADVTMDPFVGLLIGSLEDPVMARSARYWLDGVRTTESSRRLDPDARATGNDPRLDPDALAWVFEPTTSSDLVTLDALRLVLGMDAGAETEPTIQKERER